MAISKQEEGLKALENAKDIQNKFDKKGKDLQNRLLEVIKREDEVTQVGICILHNYWRDVNKL